MPWFTKSITCSRSAVIFTCYFHEMTCCGTTVTTYSKPFIKPTFYIFLTFCKYKMPCWPLRGPLDQWSLNIAGLAVPTLTADNTT